MAVRTKLYWQVARRYLPELVTAALGNAGVRAHEIDAVVFVSCTGFTMPSPIVWLIDELGFRDDIDQFPIAQLGCTAGSRAIGIAADHCRTHPERQVLIVAFELCSLCYQPTDVDVGSLLSAGLFGDGFAAAVISGTGGGGLHIERSASATIPGTASWISYEIKETGFHFRLDRRVRTTMTMVAPRLKEFLKEAGMESGELGFIVAHAGGPRIIDDLTELLETDPSLHRFSRAALSEHGNTASVLIFDSLRRFCDEADAPDRARGLIAGFGPGVTAAYSLATFVH